VALCSCQLETQPHDVFVKYIIGSVEFTCIVLCCISYENITSTRNYSCQCIGAAGKMVKFSYTRYQALGPELIPVYRQAVRRWLFKFFPSARLPLLSTRPAVTLPRRPYIDGQGGGGWSIGIPLMSCCSIVYRHGWLALAWFWSSQTCWWWSVLKLPLNTNEPLTIYTCSTGSTSAAEHALTISCWVISW